MTGIPKLEIQESVEELKELMKRQKTSLAYAKVQSLYLLKTGVAETARYVAVIIGREESTIHRWLQRYREGGIKALLEKKLKTGRPKKLEVENVAKLQQELREPFMIFQLSRSENMEHSYPRNTSELCHFISSDTPGTKSKIESAKTAK